VAESITGERTLVSTDPAVAAANPVVEALSVGWPQAAADSDQ